MRELVAASRDAGDLETLPDRVESVILSRIDTLAPEDRFLLRNASVLGQRFELDLVAEILEPELKGVDDLGRWDRLAEFVAWEEGRTRSCTTCSAASRTKGCRSSATRGARAGG